MNVLLSRILFLLLLKGSNGLYKMSLTSTYRELFQRQLQCLWNSLTWKHSPVLLCVSVLSSSVGGSGRQQISWPAALGAPGQLHQRSGLYCAAPDARHTNTAAIFIASSSGHGVNIQNLWSFAPLMAGSNYCREDEQLRILNTTAAASLLTERDEQV